MLQKQRAEYKYAIWSPNMIQNSQIEKTAQQTLDFPQQG